MGLPVIFSKISHTAKSALGPVGLLAKKRAPELMLAAGGASFILTIVETVKATNETNDILEYKEKKMAIIADENTINQQYTDDMRERDEKALTRNTRVEIVKVWGKVAIPALATLICFGGVYKIVNGRYVGACMAYESLDEIHKRYRQNVVDEFGREVDWRMANNIKAEEMAERRKALEAAEEERDQEQQKKKKKLRGDKCRTQYDKYSNNQIFDSHSSTRWKRWWLPQQVIDFVHQVELEIQSKVEEEGSAVLNDAFDRLGMPRTAQGAIVGWVKRPGEKHDQPGHYVSLGFANDETPESEIRRILNSPSNDEIFVWICPNCDGVIYQLIDVPFGDRK